MERFDHVFLACHSDQALRLLQQPAEIEKNTLANIQYQTNTAVLHTDPSLMPKQAKNWSAWNYWVPKDQCDEVKVTYYMNRLQNLRSSTDYFVTLNFDDHIDQEKIIYRTNYMHPVFNFNAINAQQSFSEINGINNTWYCGAYWRNGFHEDGVWSAVEAVNLFKSKVSHEQLYIQRASLTTPA